MNRLTVTINGREVYWDLPVDLIASMLTQFVAAFGPAEEDEL